MVAIQNRAKNIPMMKTSTPKVMAAAPMKQNNIRIIMYDGMYFNDIQAETKIFGCPSRGLYIT
jgi:hypothetical protein